MLCFAYVVYVSVSKKNNDDDDDDDGEKHIIFE